MELRSGRVVGNQKLFMEVYMSSGNEWPTPEEFEKLAAPKTDLKIFLHHIKWLLSYSTSKKYKTFKRRDRLIMLACAKSFMNNSTYSERSMKIIQEKLKTVQSNKPEWFNDFVEEFSRRVED
jgi:hypothetical protein